MPEAGVRLGMTEQVQPARANRPITVVALCYNHERFVLDCLESIRAQTCQDFELIVIDDASTDASPNLIQDWLSKYRPDAKFLPQRSNRGICAVLNIAVQASTGRFLAMISTDDLWEPTKLQRQLEYFELVPDDVAVVYSDALRIDEQGLRIPGNFIQSYLPDHAPPSGGLIDMLTERNFIPAMSTLIRISALKAVGGYDEDLVFEDYDMWLRLAERFRIEFLNAELASYRIVPSSLGHRLFVSRTLGVSATLCQMAIKQIRSSYTTPGHRSIWRYRLIEESEKLYGAGDPRAKRYLREVARQTGNVRDILVAVAATLGVSQKRAQRIRAFVARIGRGHVP
jgi:glycosyltransferase involved in cell wall biosynthesis